MARLTKPLSNTEIDRAKPKAREYNLADGMGLFLRIKPNGAKSWLFNYYRPFSDKRTNLGLGSYPELSLAQARTLRDEYRALLVDNIDPKTYREQQATIRTLENANTFRVVAEKYFAEIYPLKAHNESTRAKNWARLENHLLPLIGDLPLAEITPRRLIALYQAIGASNTLDKLHRLIISVMNYGIKLGLIEGHNCDIAKEDFIAPLAKNHPAITPDELPELLRIMNTAFLSGGLEPNTFLAFNLSLLTGLRQKELTTLEWRFIDDDKAQIIVPSENLKQTTKLKEQPRDHIIPQSSQIVRLLATIKLNASNSPFLFPSVRNRLKPMGVESVRSALKEKLKGTALEGRQDAHGLRSVFRTYLTEQKIDVIVAELCLSHLSIGKSKTQAVYDRYEYLDERQKALQLWGDYCEQSGMMFEMATI